MKVTVTAGAARAGQPDPASLLRTVTVGGTGICHGRSRYDVPVTVRGTGRARDLKLLELEVTGSPSRPSESPIPSIIVPVLPIRVSRRTRTR